MEETATTFYVMSMILTFIGSLAASSGFWLFIAKKSEGRSLTNQLLLGLAHDRIIFLGLMYLKRGSITQDEYENIHDCIFCPYQKMGGNGFAKKMIDEINKLPIRDSSIVEEAKRQAQTNLDQTES